MSTKPPILRFNLASMLVATAGLAVFCAFGIPITSKMQYLIAHGEGAVLAAFAVLLVCFTLLFVPGLLLIMRLLTGFISDVGSNRVPEEASTECEIQEKAERDAISSAE